MSLVQGVPDIVQEKSKFSQNIDLVGIQGLKIPIRLTSRQTAMANVSLHVSLEDKKTRGIHMSRLYSSLHTYFSNNIVHFEGLKKVLIAAIKSQKGISQSGRIRLESHWPILRKALKSSLSGWREYPFYFELNYFKKNKVFTCIAGGEVLYSSTCPCSASLSQKVIKQEFEKQFSKQKSFKKEDVLKYVGDKKFLVATPHAQKSKAFFKLQIGEKLKKSFSVLKTVDAIEKSLGTPVQTAVKREDETEFARLNAQNLMFCEDAVRRLGFLFKNNKDILDYMLHVQHYESLHPFTVESTIVKGIEGGWRA